MTKPIVDKGSLGGAEAILAEGARDIARSLRDLERRARRTLPFYRRYGGVAAVAVGVAAGVGLAVLISRLSRPRAND